MNTMDHGAFSQAEYDRRFHGDFMYDATVEDDDGGSSRSPLFIILTLLVVAAFAAVVWVAYQQGVKQGDRGAPPVIPAEAGPIRIQPEDPGGLTVPDQDKSIYDGIAGAPAPAEEAALAAPPETPIDLPAPPPSAAAPVVALETPGDAEAGEVALADEAESAPISPEQAQAEAAAREQAAKLASEIDKLDPGVAAAAAKAPAVGAGEFVVQLGAFKQDSEAAAMWQTIKTRNTEQLGGMRPDIKRVDLAGKGVWYRLRVGPFEKRADAVALCEVLKTRKTDCVVGKP